MGPKKLRVVLQTKHGIESPEATSAIGSILKRSGLARTRRRGPGANRVEPGELTVPTRPQRSLDGKNFKGWFLLGKGQRCGPLTACDLNTHYVLGCKAMPNQQHSPVRCASSGGS